MSDSMPAVEMVIWGLSHYPETRHPPLPQELSCSCWMFVVMMVTCHDDV